MLSLFGLLVEHVGVKEIADLFIIVFQAFEYQEGRNVEKDLGVALLQLLSKLRVLLGRRLNHLREVEQLVAFFVIDEVGQTLAPTVFEFNENFYKFDVVLELRIDNFNILLVFSKKIFEILEGLLYAFCQVADSFRLSWANSSVNSFCCLQDLVTKVVPSHPLWVGH